MVCPRFIAPESLTTLSTPSYPSRRRRRTTRKRLGEMFYNNSFCLLTLSVGYQMNVTTTNSAACHSCERINHRKKKKKGKFKVKDKQNVTKEQRVMRDRKKKVWLIGNSAVDFSSLLIPRSQRHQRRN